MRILLIDNRDSFTHNLEHLLAAAADCAPVVVPYAPPSASGAAHGAFAQAEAAGWDLAVISPGPGGPEEYPGYGPLLESGTPVLGICLGLQIINIHFGGLVTRLPDCMHGKTSAVALHGVGNFTVARYHSLHVAALGAGLTPLAHTLEGVVMAARHATLPVMGYQFHPESFLTPDGVFWIRHAFALLGLS